MYVCVCAQRGDRRRWVVVTKGRFLFLHDVSRTATPLYEIYFYIGKKYSRNRERKSERGVMLKLQEVGGQRAIVDYAREG